MNVQQDIVEAKNAVEVEDLQEEEEYIHETEDTEEVQEIEKNFQDNDNLQEVENQMEDMYDLGNEKRRMEEEEEPEVKVLQENSRTTECNVVDDQQIQENDGIQGIGMSSS